MSLSFAIAGDGLKEKAEALAGRALEWACRQPLLHMAMLAALIAAAHDLLLEPQRLTTMIGDTDDATRLVEVRQLLAGQAWHDMTIPRFGGTEPLISHWSRLIDLPLAAMIFVLTPIMGEPNAELVTRMLWPTLLSGVVLYIVARYCESVSSRKTALLTLVIAIPAMGHCQFTPGRIDHHNGMIIGALGGTLALLSSLDRPQFGWLAGLMFGIGCSIGLEGLGLTAAVLGIVTLTTIVQGNSLAGIARAAAGFAATLIVGLVAFGPFRPDGAVMCDALSTNLIMLASASATGVALAHYARCHGASKLVTFAYTAAFGAAGLALYTVAEPACLHGPYGQLAPALGPIWLDGVLEVQSPLLVLESSKLTGLVMLGFVAAAFAYAIVVLGSTRIRHAELYAAIFLVSLLLGLWQIRLLTYASFLAVPLIAWGLHRGSGADAPAPRARLKQMTFAGVGLVGVALIAGPVFFTPGPTLALPGSESADAKEEQDCTSGRNIAPLAALAPGLAIADMNLGPYIVVHTRLNSLAAPYHRMGKAILATHDFMNASVEEAKPRMKQLGARYIVLCSGLPPTTPVTQVPGDALRTNLLAGHTPNFLEPLALGDTPIKAWRLKDE